jgi:Resolvase, N terminal domain
MAGVTGLQCLSAPCPPGDPCRHYAFLVCCIPSPVIGTLPKFATKPNYVHQMVLLEEFEGYGCQVDFLDQPISQDPQNHLLLQIRGAVAEYERTLIAERMRRGRQVKLRAGLLLPWPSPPYGYRVHPDRPRDPAGVEREPTEGAIVQEFVFQKWRW